MNVSLRRCTGTWPYQKKHVSLPGQWLVWGKANQDDGVHLEGLILILWEGITVCVGSTGTACWGQPVCTDLAGGVAAS